MRINNWNVKTQNEETVFALTENLKINPVLARLLINRNLSDASAVKDFLNKDKDNFYDPFLMKDMEKAVKRIREAIYNKEKITVYGDYDVDGITSTSVLYLYLKEKKADVNYFIPNRNTEGYGINKSTLDKLALSNTSLLISVDTGITAMEEVEYAKELGMDVIITDHHECGETVPNCVAVVNPKQKDCNYPFKELAGVGVVFKIICALEGEAGFKNILENYGDLVCIGTIADVMPLYKENRAIATKGLEIISKTKRIGLRALISQSMLQNKKITSGSIGYVLSPRINASGRMGSAERAVELFSNDNYKEALVIAEELCEENRKRQITENEIFQQCVAKIKNEADLEKDKAIVLWDDGWNNGVIGIVASRLCDKYYLPSILVSFDGNKGKGSGRSIKNFNLYEALSACCDTLEKFGGHELAAGLSVSRDRILDFKKAMQDYAAKNIKEKDLIMSIDIECELSPEDISLGTAKSISLLEPFGMGNEVPKFLMKDVEISYLTSVGNDKHTKLTLKKGNMEIQAFCFSNSLWDFGYSIGDKVDIVFNLDINSYRGNDSVQLIIKDISLSKEDLERFNENKMLYKMFKNKNELSDEQAKELLPTRDDFVAVYKFIIYKNISNSRYYNFQSLNRDISYHSGRKISYAKMRICLDVLNEMKLISFKNDENKIFIEAVQTSKKVDLSQSKIIKELKELSAE
ncbi:MAG: single-stranded-DNA-specific exonuclease RecJ [Clostridia bacterium]|nr:single-stranded-DNA-specific exonuclease RecJ [Clostridia bacterium]